MKKEDLIAMGLSEDQAKKVMDSLDGDFVTKARFNEVNEENKRLKTDISDRDKQLEALKKSTGDNAEIQKQIADLQKANADQKKAHEAEMNKLKLDNAVEAALVAAGAKNGKAVRALFDEAKFKLKDGGEVEGLTDAIKAVQKSDPYLFAEKKDTQQTLKGFQPGNSGDAKPGDKVDVTKMTYSEMVAYLAANPGAKIE